MAAFGFYKYLFIFNVLKIKKTTNVLNKFCFGRMRMQKTMQNHAAVFRTGPVMREGIDKERTPENLGSI